VFRVLPLANPVVDGSSGDRIARWIESFSGPWLYVVVVALTFAETGTMFFLVPGEVGLFVAGAAAGAGQLNLPLMIVLACGAAIGGDALGFYIGHRFGPRLPTSRLGRRLKPEVWQRAEKLVRRRRGLVVLVGRWIGFLRAVMPATAGLSGMTYREFLPWDLLGAISWATICVVGGYKLGSNWTTLADNLGKVGLVLGALVVVLTLVWAARRRRPTPTPG
jgi:membrane protein DedA with SNARE-associated domain